MTYFLSSHSKIFLVFLSIIILKRIIEAFHSPAILGVHQWTRDKGSIHYRGSPTSRLTCCFHNNSKSDNNEKDGIIGWVTNHGLDRIARASRASAQEIASRFADVVYYENSLLEPSLYRINTKRDDTITLVIPKDPSDTFMIAMAPNVDSSWKRIQEASSMTLRWCSNFVQTLNLCPWAKLSLSSHNAVKIVIVNQNLGLENMEQIIRNSSYDLLDVTDRGIVDENSGITFVVAIPDKDDDGAQNDGFDFESFYEYSTDLEDRLFNEADLMMMETVDEDCHAQSSDLKPSLGDEIIIAPFHPDWYWYSGVNEDRNSQDLNDDHGSLEQASALDYEKKSPFPTISIVRARVVLQAGEEVTRRIGIHNEKLLRDMGSERLRDLYETNVVENHMESM